MMNKKSLREAPFLLVTKEKIPAYYSFTRLYPSFFAPLAVERCNFFHLFQRNSSQFMQLNIKSDHCLIDVKIPDGQ